VFWVEAQEFPLKVTSSIVTVGGEFGFLLNRTLLDHVHPVKTSPILYFWLSTNSLSHINGSELRIAVFNVGGAPLIYGTLLVPPIVLAWVKAQTAKVYLKVSASSDIGSPAIVSDRVFTLILDLSLTDQTLTIVDPITGDPQSRFAYYRFFGISDSIRFNINLTPLLTLHVKSSELDMVKVHNVTLTYRDQMLYVSLDLDALLVYTNFLRTATGIGSTRVANITGLIGDFPLLHLEKSMNITGIKVAYQPFNVTLTAYTKIEVKNGLKIDRGIVKGVLHRDIWRAPIASIMQSEELQFYPSINNTFALDKPTICTGFYIDARNFKPGVYTLAFFYRAENPQGPYKLLPGTMPITLVIDSNGRGSTSSSLPDNPYGGRFTIVTISFRGLEGPWALAGPGVRVYPILTVTGFDIEGAPGAEPRFTPGEYILVHGRGWLDIPFEKMTASLTLDGKTYVLKVIESRGVDERGVLAAILKIPHEAILPSGSTVKFNLSMDLFNSYTLEGRVSYERPLVYIQPKPLILRVTPTLIEARIVLGADRFPYTAFWEPEQLRRFTIETIALPPGIPTVIYLKPANVTIKGLNETGAGYIMVEAPVPEITQGVYSVRIQLIHPWGFDYIDSSTRKEHSLRVWATVAVVVPVYGRIVILPSPYDITIKGVGFTPELRVYYDIPKLGVYNFSVIGVDGDIARPNVKGTFVGFIPLSTIAKAPNTYIIKVHQRPDNGTVVTELTVTIGVPPPLVVEVRVTPVRYADERVGIWITAFYGGIIASIAQVSEVDVRVTLLLRWTGGFKEASLTVKRVLDDKAIFLAEFTPITLFGREALGGEVFIMVTIKGRYATGQQEDTVTTTALITIPPITLAKIIEVFQVTPGALREILEVTRMISANMDHIIALLTEQGVLIASNLEDLERMIRGIREDVSVVKLSLDRITSDLSKLYTLVLRIEGGVNSTLTTLTIVRKVLENVENVVLLIKGDTLAIRTMDIPRVLEVLASLNKTLASRITLEIEGIRVAIGDLRTVMMEGFKGLSDSIASSTLAIVSRVDITRDSIIKLMEISTTIRGLIESTSRDIVAVKVALDSLIARIPGLEDRVTTIGSKVDLVVAKLADLSEKKDVEAAKTTITGEVRGVQVTLLEELKRSKEDITTSTRNWALLNTIITLLVLILIAYTVFLVRRTK